MHFLYQYKVDWEKVKTTEDVIRLLKAMDITFEPGNHSISSISDLIQKVDKSPPQPVMD